MGHVSGNVTPFGLSEIHEDEESLWLPLPPDKLSYKLDIKPIHDKGTIELAPTAAQQAAAAAAATKRAISKILPDPHPAAWPPFTPGERRRNIILFVCVSTAIIVACVLGPVLYLKQSWAAAAAALNAERNRVIPPLPPMAPVTEVFYDGFSYLNWKSWSHSIGNGIERGEAFWGFGNGELQCYTPSQDNVNILAPDPSSHVLRLQAIYYPKAVPCADRAPFDWTTTHWSSGRLVSKSKRIFQAPQQRGHAKNITGNCMSLYIEARVRFPSVKGSRGSIILLPEPQNQTADTTSFVRCGWVDECGKYGRWPASGEIDLVSHSDTHSTVSHAIQLKEYGQHAWRVGGADLGGTAAEWHTYRLEWNCEYLRWYVDGVESFQVSRLSVQPWPFDQPFFMAIEYSIGGRLVGPEVDQVSSYMLVDYVRVWPADSEAPTANVVTLAQPAVSQEQAAVEVLGDILSTLTKYGGFNVTSNNSAGSNSTDGSSNAASG